MTVCLFYAAILFVPAPRNNFLNLRTSAAAEGEEGAEGYKPPVVIVDENWTCGPWKDEKKSPIEEVEFFPGPDSSINRFVYCFLL